MKRLTDLTQQQLHALLHYDPDTGVFRWLGDRTNGRGQINAAAGSVAGSVNKKSGYRSIGIAGRLYKAHRLAWLYVTGVWPIDELDHRDTVRDNNAFENLREATRQLNNENNRLARVGNPSGLLGAHYVGPGRPGPYRAKICCNGKRYFLGYFQTAEEAHAAYVAKKRELHAGCTL